MYKDAHLKSYEKVSRYTSVPFYYDSDSDKYIYGTAKKMKRNTPFAEYQVKQGDTFDSLALDNYDDAQFYWVIAEFNGINDPFLKLRVGAKIRIPVLSEIEFMG